MNNKQNLTSFVYTNFEIKHQKNGTYYLNTPFICKTRNKFLLNKDDLIKLNTQNKINIFYDDSIKVSIQKSEEGKIHKFIGNSKYIVIIKELNNDIIDDCEVDDGYESDATVLNTGSDSD